jgi:hypothetical protein
MVWVLRRGYRYTPVQVAPALRSLLLVRQVVCHTPAVLAGLNLCRLTSKSSDAGAGGGLVLSHAQKSATTPALILPVSVVGG